MSLTDRTNEEIVLSLMESPSRGTQGTLVLDADYDSSFYPANRVCADLYLYGDQFGDTEVSWSMTYDEAHKMWDRLGRILAIETDPELEVDAGSF